MFALIDNYDSFTYNLVQYFGILDIETCVIRNDEMPAADVLALRPQALVISPGPGSPDESGMCLDLIRLAETNDIPLLGVCLGHQCLGQVYGGNIIRTHPMHGKVSQISHTSKSVFADLPETLEVTRYHSLVIDPSTLPSCLEVTARTQDNIIMGVKHKTAPLHGVQFHPESIATDHGLKMLENFKVIVKNNAQRN